MRQFFIGIFLISIPLLTNGQGETEISVTDLIKEIQQTRKKDNKMSFVWWVPNEYWGIAIKDNKQIPKEAVIELENVFKDYVMIWACDLTINLDGTMDYTGEEEIKKHIAIIDDNNVKHLPLSKNQIEGAAFAVAENMKPFFAQALGQMGRGIYFYFFKIKDDSGKNVINATLPGEFKVIHLNSEFYWKLPLTTLLPPKFCPIDKEKMKGNWIFCPIHGQKL